MRGGLSGFRLSGPGLAEDPGDTPGAKPADGPWGYRSRPPPFGYQLLAALRGSAGRGYRAPRGFFLGPKTVRGAGWAVAVAGAAAPSAAPLAVLGASGLKRRSRCAAADCAQQAAAIAASGRRSSSPGPRAAALYLRRASAGPSRGHPGHAVRPSPPLPPVATAMSTSARSAGFD